MTQYGSSRVLLAKDPASALSDVFGRYVERDFVTQAYQERRLEQIVRQALDSAALGKRFRKAQLGTEDFQVTLPFVEFSGGMARKVIKPLNLAHEDPTHILNHGGDWLQRLQRLRKRRVLPDAVLIAVSRPAYRGYRDEAFAEVSGVTGVNAKSDIRYRDEAFEEVCGDFAANSFAIADIESGLKIAEFAR